MPADSAAATDVDDAGVDDDVGASDGARLIVGIGTSAGGLATLERLLAAHTPGRGLGLVIVQHLDPNQESQLAHILARRANIPVEDVKQGQRVQADHAYVMPAGKSLTIKDGVLHLKDRRPGLRHPIDTFLASLAEDQEEKAVAVVLTGSGNDGTVGVKAIHGHGGLVIAQAPDEAEFPDMPESAIATGIVDLTEGVQDILARVADFSRDGLETAPEADLPAVLEVLQERGPPDFTAYRTGTLSRRLERRISLRGINDIDGYLEVLRNDGEEVERLRNDMLLGVTSFFRDEKAFQALDEVVVRRLFAKDKTSVRVWVAGCSTGEEAYSVAMLLMEERERRKRSTPIRIFATDISEAAIATARKGTYAEEELAPLTDKQRQRFFNSEGAQRFRVKPELREVLAFAAHDLLSDPPLPSMDLVVCRNLLIYLRPDAQRKVLRSFHFSLRPDGHLFLGSSENAGRFDEAFKVASKSARIYRRTDAPFVPATTLEPSTPKPREAPQPDAEVAKEWLVEHHAPPAVAIDSERRVVTVSGDVSPYLGVQPGKGSLDVVEMAHKQLRPRLRTALHQVEQQGQAAHARGVSAPDGTVDIQVEPLRDGLSLITFHPQSKPEQEPEHEEYDDAIVQELEEELRVTKLRLGETIATSEAANEELRASSEEITSMNEELRTTIEELEASKEELQSLNDELQDVNKRLTEESENARALSDDLSNLFASSGIPVMFLDRELRLRRRTPATDRLFGSDGPGTLITDIKWHFTDPDFSTDARRVLQELTPITRQISTDQGHRHRRRIVPYRTADERIDGVIVVFEDIEHLLRTEDDLRASEAYASAIVKAVPNPLLVLGDGLSIKTANSGFNAAFGFLPGDVGGRSLPGLLGGAWDLPALREIVDGDRERIDDVEVEHQEHGTPFVFHVTARRLPTSSDEPLVLMVLQDITSMKQVERDLLSFTSQLHRRVEEQASAAVEKAKLLERVSYAIGHDLKEPVRAIETLLTVLAEDHQDELSDDGQATLVEAHQESQRLVGLVRGLLAFSRAIQEDVHRVYPVSVRAALASEDCTTRFARLRKQRGAKVDVDGDGMALASLPTMGYILGNLVQNAILHNPEDGPIVHVHVREERQKIDIVVEDNGPGIPSEVVAGFDDKGVATRGFGLAIAKQMTQFLGGSMRLGASELGGAAVHVRLPAAPGEAGDERE